MQFTFIKSIKIDTCVKARFRLEFPHNVILK